MATVVTKTVKYTGGDYTTIAAALAAVTSDLVAANEQWDIVIGESAAGVYEWQVNGGFFSGLSTGSHTTDATRFIRIKAESGKGFRDYLIAHPTSPLRYDASYGIAIKELDDNGLCLTLVADYSRVEGIQLFANSSSAGQAPLRLSGANSFADSCIIGWNTSSTKAEYILKASGTNTYCVNCVLTGQWSGVLSGFFTTLDLRNCTLISTNAASGGFAIEAYLGTVKAVNTACFGFNAMFHTDSANLSSSSDYNACDLSAPTNWGSHSLAGLTAASQVESMTAGSLDARAKAGGSLINAGTRDQTYTNDLDIAGRARSTSTPTIGCWEYIAAAAANHNNLLLLGAG